MKKIIYIGLIICYSFIIIALASCKPSYHMKRYIKKGGVIDTVERIITITDTIKGKDGKDSIIYKDVEVDCPEPIIKTRWKTKIEYKYRKDSLKDKRIKYIDSLKYALKQSVINLKTEKAKQKTNRVVVRQENKKTKWYIWLLIGIVIGIISPFIIRRYLLSKLIN